MEERKYNYWCPGCTCGAQGNKRNFTIPLTEEEKNENDIKCPNDETVILKCMGYTPTWGHNKFDSMTGNEKQAVLLKRSKEHFKKEITEVKYQKNKDLVEKFKGN